jgi:ketopantoate reductase
MSVDKSQHDFGGKMKTLIVGSGVIGVIYGWALSQAGEDATHLVRPGRQDRFQDGVRLDLLAFGQS